MEALIASGILLVAVVAVTGAISAGQQNAYEAHVRIAGVFAAEELMGRLVAVDYDDLPGWNGFAEAPGEMTDMNDAPFPENFDMVGRDVEISTSLKKLDDLNVNIRGRDVIVTAVDADGSALVTLNRFIPEPQS